MPSSSIRLVAEHLNITGPYGALSASIHMSLLRPSLAALRLHRQIHPLLDRFMKPLVVGDLLSHYANLILPDEKAAAFSMPAIAELVVGSVFPGIPRILAAASRRPADVVLLADASRMHLAELGDFALNLGDALFRIVLCDADSTL